MLKNYIDLITLFSHIDFEKTLFYFHEAVAYAQEKKQLDWESAYWRRLASAFYELGKIDSSYYCIDRAIELERRQSVIIRQKTQQYLLSGGLSGAILYLHCLFILSDFTEAATANSPKPTLPKTSFSASSRTT